MHRRITGLLVTMCALTLSAQSPRPDATTLGRAVDSLVRHAIADGVTPAFGVAVTMDGQIAYRRAFGLADASRRIPADDRTRWYVASTSKSFTGFAIALLVDRGVLQLHAPISRLLPGVAWPAGVDPGALSLSAFLSHTHHLDDDAIVMSAAYTAAIPERDWPQLIARATPRRDTHLTYSNFGYNVAAMVVDRVHPGGWRDFLDREVFGPAGMAETGSTLRGAGGARIALPHRLRADGTYASEPFAKVDATMNSAGGHLSTLDDLARWTIIQMDGGVWDGRVVFPRTAVSLAHRLIAPHTREQARRFAYFDREGWGAGWDIGAYRGERMVSRFGGYASYRSHLSFLPGRRIGVVAMSTGGLGASLTDLVAAYTYDLEAGRSDAHRVAWGRLDSLRVRLSTARDAAARQEAALATRAAYPLPHPDAYYGGDYEAPGYGRIRVTASGRQLHLAWGVLEGRLIPQTAAADTLDVTLAGVTYPVTFEPSSGGAAPALVLERRRFSRAAR